MFIRSTPRNMNTYIALVRFRVYQKLSEMYDIISFVFLIIFTTGTRKMSGGINKKLPQRPCTSAVGICQPVTSHDVMT